MMRHRDCSSTGSHPLRVPGIGALALMLGLSTLGLGCSGKHAAMQEIGRNRANSYYQLGIRHMQQDQARAALSEFDRAVENDPKNPLYRSSLGLAYFAVGEYELAEEQMKKALKLDPTNTEVYSNLALVYSEMEDYDQAAAYFARALQDPSYLTPEKIYVNWGLALGKQGDPAGAEEKMRSAISTNPRYPRGHYELAKIMEERGEEIGALEEYLRAWAGMSEFPELNLKLGQMFFEQGNRARARLYLEKVIAVAPESTEAGEARVYLERLSQG